MFMTGHLTGSKHYTIPLILATFELAEVCCLLGLSGFSSTSDFGKLNCGWGEVFPYLSRSVSCFQKCTELVWPFSSSRLYCILCVTL